MNEKTAKVAIEEASKEIQLVKKVSREYEKLTRHLPRHSAPLPPDQITNIDEELNFLNSWKIYIAWEKKNPLNLKSEELVMRRVMYAYEQAFSCVGYHCDIWYEAACYLIKYGKKYASTNTTDLKSPHLVEVENQISHLFERATNTYMANNLLIHLIYADFEESCGSYQRCYELYEKCLQNSQMDATLIWIHYIRFVRRNEDIQAARRLFKRAREDSRCTYHLFIANAYLEYFSTKDKTVGFKIFQLGTKKFADIPEYMLAYIKYMSHLNEDNNTRVLFERILSSNDLPLQSTNEIWSEFLKFECAVGDLASILKVDKKRQKVFESLQNTELNECTLMVDRYKYFDLLPCNQNELKAIGYKDIPAKLQSMGQQNAANLAAQGSESYSAANDAKKAKYPVPDTSQMLPYKPVRNGIGVFPFPPAVTDLVKRLPPPSTFEGPFVKIDELMKIFQQIEISEDFQPLYVYINGEPMRDIDNLNLLTGNININVGSQTTASKRSILGSNSDDEDTKKSKTMDMDIYKQRQFKKLIEKKN